MCAPTNNAPDEEREPPHNPPRGVTDKPPRKDVVNILMGNANAKAGQDNKGYEDIMGQNGQGRMNDNGERLANLCPFNSPVTGGTAPPHKWIHKATWGPPDGLTEIQIDYPCTRGLVFPFQYLARNVSLDTTPPPPHDLKTHLNGKRDSHTCIIIYIHNYFHSYT